MEVKTLPPVVTQDTHLDEVTHTGNTAQWLQQWSDHQPAQGFSQGSLLLWAQWLSELPCIFVYTGDETTIN